MAGNVFDVSLDWYLQAKKQLEQADRNNDETLRAQAEYDMGQARELLQKNLHSAKKCLLWRGLFSSLLLLRSAGAPMFPIFQLPTTTRPPRTPFPRSRRKARRW